MKKSLFIILCSISAFIISFERTNPTILYDEMANYVDQDDSKMGIYGSMYYFASFASFLLIAFFGPKIRLSYLLSILLAIGALGSLILGFVKNFAGLCISRFIIGFGLGPTVMVVILILRLEHDEETAFLSQNILFLLDMFGALFTVGPYSSIIVSHGWVVTLEIFSGFLILLSIIFFFLAPNVSITYSKSTNSNLTDFDMSNRSSSGLGFFKNYIFSLLWYVFTLSGTLNLTTMWCGPYLTNFYLFTGVEAGYVMMTFFIGGMIGSLFYGFIFGRMKGSLFGRKIVHISSNVGLFIAGFIFMLLKSSTNFVGILILLFILGFFGIGPSSIMFSIISNSFSTQFHLLYGISNSMLYLMTGIFQLISSFTINHISKNKIDIEPKAFRFNFWIPLLVENIIAFACALFINITDGMYMALSER